MPTARRPQDSYLSVAESIKRCSGGILRIFRSTRLALKAGVAQFGFGNMCSGVAGPTRVAEIVWPVRVDETKKLVRQKNERMQLMKLADLQSKHNDEPRPVIGLPTGENPPTTQ